MRLTVKQIASILGITERAVQKSCKAGRYESAACDTSSRGGANGEIWTVSAYDPNLPGALRAHLGLSEQMIEQARSNVAKEVVNVNAENLKDPKTALRLRVLRKIGNRPNGISMLDWLNQIASEEGISVQTIYRWRAEAKDGKVTSDRAPIPVSFEAKSGPLSTAIKTRAFSPKAAEYGISLLLNNPEMDIKRAYKELCVAAEQAGWEIGSLQSFYRIYEQIPDGTKIFAKSGRRGFEAIAKPPIYRDYTKYNVYEVLVGDQHIFDYTVLDDEGNTIRPQMFAWGDMRSRYFSGLFPVLGNYDKYAVGLALREACRWGLPESLYTDWGKPECSQYVRQLRQQLSGYTALRNMDGTEDVILHKKAKPRNPQAKPIESWFYHAVEGPLKQRNLPGFSRRNEDEKRNEFIQARLREEIKNNKLLHYKAFFEIFMQCIEDWHNHEMTEDKTIPAECFAEGIQRPGITRVSERTLDFLFLPAERRIIRNSMIEMTVPGFGRCRWFAPELSMKGRGASVEVRYNPYDCSVAHIIDLDTHEFICTAERWDKIDPHDKDGMTEKIKRQTQLSKWHSEIMRQFANVITKVHRITPYEHAATEIPEEKKTRENLAVKRKDVDAAVIEWAAKIA